MDTRKLEIDRDISKLISDFVSGSTKRYGDSAFATGYLMGILTRIIPMLPYENFKMIVNDFQTKIENDKLDTE